MVGIRPAEPYSKVQVGKKIKNAVKGKLVSIIKGTLGKSKIK
jgi:hypothetical protein